MKTISAKSKDLKTINEAIRQNVNGTPVTVSSAFELVTLPATLLTTTEYSVPLSLVSVAAVV